LVTPGAVGARDEDVAARREGTLAVKLRTYTAPTVLVLDDVGLLP
jgi:DNA replication protein DnaC